MSDNAVIISVGTTERVWYKLGLRRLLEKQMLILQAFCYV